MFLYNYRRNYGISVGNSVGISLGNSVGNKKYYYRRVCSISKFIGNNIPTNLPMGKTLPTNDSPTDHFRL